MVDLSDEEKARILAEEKFRAQARAEAEAEQRRLQTDDGSLWIPPKKTPKKPGEITLAGKLILGGAAIFAMFYVWASLQPQRSRSNEIGGGMISRSAIESCRSRLTLSGHTTTDDEMHNLGKVAVSYARAYNKDKSDAMLELCTAMIENDRATLSRFGL